ncbi:MAG: hypothetical protein NTZ87_03560 [Candidatus Nomurabacteria bacterium]|nr:hypothetical protein [Candidatus Nomurabacteria bacterium]
MIVVNKFGGGILDGAVPVKHLLEVFKSFSSETHTVNVFSAFGKTTNNLEKIVKSYVSREEKESEKTVNELKAFHIGIASELFPAGHVVFGIIEDVFKKINKTLADIGHSKDAKLVYDQIVPFGEILASLIVSNYFSFMNVPNKLVFATDFLCTDSNFNSANVDKQATYENLKLQITEQMFKSHKNIITQGFIGFYENKKENNTRFMTTLGREGSDYTAGILGNLLRANRVVLWKDVPGVMDKNPKLSGNENAKKIDSLTYDRLDELLKTTALGLVHPKTLNEVKEKRIPLQVRPFWDLNSEGTLIS